MIPAGPRHTADESGGADERVRTPAPSAELAEPGASSRDSNTVSI